MTVFVVMGWNGLLKVAGPLGVARTKEKAEEIVQKNAYMIDKHKIIQQEVEG